MHIKWQYYLLILTLVILGVASQQQYKLANQELVLHFSDIKSTSIEAQHTISIVKNKLGELGVDNIQVKNADNGTFKITYYSAVEASRVKSILSKEKTLKLNYPIEHKNGLPSEKDNPRYGFDVYEIQNLNNLDTGFDGCILVEKSDRDRFFEPNLYSYSAVFGLINENYLYSINRENWKPIEFSIENSSYIFPEVRAGPLNIEEA